MMIINLLIPIALIIFGRHFKKGGPKVINMVYGYRTTMSMKNTDTWMFAHKHCGRLWWLVGWIMLVLSICAMLLVMAIDLEASGTFGSIVNGMQCAILIASLFPTQIALNKNFDKQGNRKV